MTPATTGTHPAKGASILALFAGLWFFISPWIFSAENMSAWNGWIVGALIFVSALIRTNRLSATGLSWLNSILGVWSFLSPWIYGYTGNVGLLINSLFIGTVVFCASLIAANSERMYHDTTSTL